MCVRLFFFLLAGFVGYMHDQMYTFYICFKALWPYTQNDEQKYWLEYFLVFLFLLFVFFIFMLFVLSYSHADVVLCTVCVCPTLNFDYEKVLWNIQFSYIIF